MLGCFLGRGWLCMARDILAARRKLLGEFLFIVFYYIVRCGRVGFFLVEFRNYIIDRKAEFVI